MLQQVCDYIHNYFISKDNGVPRVWQGNYTIASGVISPAPPLKEGQRFMIIGSDLNDGIYTYYADAIMNDDDKVAAELRDEVFSGSIAAMSVPIAIMNAIVEGLAWREQHASAMNGQYNSENVSGVYSYTISPQITEALNHPLGLPAYITNQFERWRKPCPM